MTLPFTKPPESICILRLSAIGDISHTLPIVRTIQQHWPQTSITWIIGKTEYSLVCDIPGINFIVFDKKRGVKAYLEFYRTISKYRFDALLHMQMSMRASLLSLMIKARYKIGFDKNRAKDMQWLFSNVKIDYKPRQHVIDSFFCFSETLGINEHVLKWDIPVPEAARQKAKNLLGEHEKILIISPCSSMAYRNWNVSAYAAVAEYAHKQHGMHVVLTGGPTDIEKKYGDGITAATSIVLTNLIGQTNLKELLAVLMLADVVISPDAGPAHLATAVGTPVIGLYATTNPDRARPYLSKQWDVNRYDEAVRDKYGKTVDEMPWGTRVRDDGTMNRITIEDVTSKLDEFMQTR